jgi:hypothetical protein
VMQAARVTAVKNAMQLFNQAHYPYSSHHMRSRAAREAPM